MSIFQHECVIYSVLVYPLMLLSHCYIGNQYRIIILSDSPGLHGVTMLNNRQVGKLALVTCSVRIGYLLAVYGGNAGSCAVPFFSIVSVTFLTGR
jgi:hypothetical protein